MKKIFFLFLIFIFINSFSNNLYINNYPFNNSLANTKIKQIYQDHNDFLWLITNNEIYKYDGKNISDMSQNNENYFINYFFQDFSNNYWLATDKGLVSFSSSDNSYDLFSLNEVSINSITQKNERFLILSTNKGILNFDIRSKAFSTVNNDLENFSVNEIEFLNSNYYLATNKGILEYDPEKNSYKSYIESLEIKNFVYCNNNLWFYTKDSLYSFNIESKNILKHLENIEINNILEYENFLWIAHKNGLMRMNLVSKEFQNLDFEFNVNFLYKDKYDYIWFSNEKYGLSRVNVKSNFENKVFDNVTFKTFLVDDEGFIWIINDGNFKLYNSFSKKWVDIPLNIDENINFIKDNKQNIFLASNEKIFSFDKKDYSISVFQDLKERINDILIDKDQNLWISTENGLYYLDKDLKPIISGSNITFLSNNEGFIWGISENNKIIEYNNNNKNYRIIEDDFDNNFQDIIFSNEKLYISTNTSILSYDIITKTYKTLYNGNIGNNLEKDKYGNIWFSTKKGIAKIFPFEERIIHYGENDGIYIEEEFIDSYVFQSNKIYFLSKNSLTQFYVEDIKSDITFHPLILKSIQSNKNVYNFEEKNNYKLTEDNIEIFFEYADYKDKILTRYKFNGEDEWNYTNTTSIKLSKLQQGKYEITLQTVDESKQFIGEEKNIKFSISYNIFSTDYAIFIYIILILLSFLAVIYLLFVRTREKWNDKTKQLIRQHIEESQENNKHLEKLNKKIEKLSFYDSLTGIQNLRLFDEMIEREWNLAKRKGYPLSIIIIDIDDFKNYNDEYGHLKGDEVLMKVANSLKSCLRRATDHIFRYSGEKFAAILPDTDKPGSKVVSENMRLAIENLNIEHKKSETADHLTISIGTSTEIPTNKKEIDTFISEAEEALLKAKDKGKNKTIQYSNLKENDS